ncbi:hypothetical protein [Algiphilus sp.]|uniref:hypothetical protein n=1 Tax=Algiphilus sp. TaxID=1872431 RepID=UPI0025B96654|nr:hypothetical protein [Algiphilus sp.]MCK5770116.1 hypothetical protein [Algiphilus sp.]
MPSRPIRTLILAIALVLGQWLALAHATEHLGAADEPLCEVCLHAKRLDAPGIAAVPVASCDRHVAEAPGMQRRRERPAAPRCHLSIRGPPTHAA